jgi:hypothetical protein
LWHTVSMSRVERVEEAVKALDADELAQFRAWFAEYDWAVWDQQLERDVRGGRLNDLADEALQDHGSGRTKPL